MAGRLALAFGVYLLAVNGSRRRGRGCGAALVARPPPAWSSACSPSSSISASPAVLAVAAGFPRRVALVGAQVRAGGPLQYPTIASMYLEIAFAFGLGLLLMAIDDARRAALSRGGAVAAVITQGDHPHLHARRPDHDRRQR